jgi:hypothetical protein
MPKPRRKRPYRIGHVEQSQTFRYSEEKEPNVEHTQVEVDKKGQKKTVLQNLRKQSMYSAEQAAQAGAVAPVPKEQLSGGKEKTPAEPEKKDVSTNTSYLRSKKKIAERLRQGGTTKRAKPKDYGRKKADDGTVTRETTAYERSTQKYYQRGKGKGTVKTSKSERFVLDPEGKKAMRTHGVKEKYVRGAVSSSVLRATEGEGAGGTTKENQKTSKGEVYRGKKRRTFVIEGDARLKKRKYF